MCETSNRSLTLCYEFIDHSDSLLDYMCTEDLLDADWIPLSSFQKSVRFDSSLPKEKGRLPLYLFKKNDDCAILNRVVKRMRYVMIILRPNCQVLPKEET